MRTTARTAWAGALLADRPAPAGLRHRAGRAAGRDRRRAGPGHERADQRGRRAQRRRPARPPRRSPRPTSRRPRPSPRSSWPRGPRARRSATSRCGCATSTGTPARSPGSTASSTVKGVKGFQDKRGLKKTGNVDATTWTQLTKRTKTPTKDERHNVLRPGKAIYQQGSSGDKVRELQARLKQIAWFSGSVTGTYGSATASAVKGFQDKRGIPETGEVDARTWSRLVAMTRTPTDDAKHNRTPKPSAKGLDQRCLTGRAICISKSTNSLTWVVDGKAQLKMDVRFGAVGDADARGELQHPAQGAHLDLDDLPLEDAVLDVLLGRPGRALQLRLRRPRLRRRLARLRQRPEPLRHLSRCSPRPAPATR